MINYNQEWLNLGRPGQRINRKSINIKYHISSSIRKLKIISMAAQKLFNNIFGYKYLEKSKWNGIFLI